MTNAQQVRKLLTTLVLILSISFMGETTYAKEQLPKINFLGIEHSPLVVGDRESLYITSDYEGNVQYRVWINKVNSSIWEDITEGYTKAIDAKIPYVISPDRVFDEGKYKLSVWVKKAGSEGVNRGSSGSYDTYYTANLNCVKKDDNNRVYVSGTMDIEKEEYTLGEEVIIRGIDQINGIKGPYKYKLHYFSPSKASDENLGWVKNVTDYDDKIVWMPTEPGIYVLDVHISTEGSTTWNTYIKKKKENNLDDLSGTYEAWKIKVIKVNEKIHTEEKTNIDESNKSNELLDGNNPKIIVSDDITGEIDTTAPIPGGNTGGNTGGTETVPPPISSSILKGISIVMNNGNEIISSGDETTLNADISMFEDSSKLIYLGIKVSKDCILEIKGVAKEFTLKVDQTNEIFMNDLDPDIDVEGDGVSMSNLRKYLADKDGYIITTQTLTYGTETKQVVLKIKVK